LFEGKSLPVILYGPVKTRDHLLLIEKEQQEAKVGQFPWTDTWVFDNLVQG
jgi:hypothetical protein